MSDSDIWNDDFEPVPPGEYRVVIDKVGYKTGFKSGVDYLGITFLVNEGPYQGQRIFSNFYVESDSARVKERSQARLNAVVQACGVTASKAYSELWKAECVITVDIQPARGNFKASNQLRGVRPADKPNARPAGAAPESQRTSTANGKDGTTISLPPPLPNDDIPF